MKKIFSILVFLVILMMITNTVFAGAALPEDWCPSGEGSFVPCPGYEHLDVFDCEFWLDCDWFTEVCIDGGTYTVGVYFDPAKADEEELINNEWYPVGACASTGCRLVNQEQVIRYTNGTPAQYTELWYVGNCTSVSWGNSNGNHFQSSLWFNQSRNFEWVKVNDKLVKHGFTTNPTLPGRYHATLIGDGPGGYWTIVVNRGN